MKTALKKRLSILLVLAMLFNSLSGFTVLAETLGEIVNSAYDDADDFMRASPSEAVASDANAIYEAQWDDDVKDTDTEYALYSYVKQDGMTYYRVYGTLDGKTGFYACDSIGMVFIPAEALDLAKEKEAAFTDEEHKKNVFTESTAAEIPPYYSLAGQVYDIEEARKVYLYVDEDGGVGFRVFGKLDGKNEGFYLCNSGGEVLNYTVLDQNTEKADTWKEFEFVEADEEDVPKYYTVLKIKTGEFEDNALYSYKKNDGVTYYRVYGEVNGSDTGFYQCQEMVRY